MRLSNFFSGVNNIMTSTRLICALIVVLGGAVGTLHAQTITLTTTTDEVNGTTTSIAALIGTPGGAGISLREAVIASNNEPVGTTITINLPAGTYTLTITGAAEDASATGDLDINSTALAGTKTVVLSGAGSGTTTINTAAGWNDRILDLEHVNQLGDLTVNVSGITFTGGNVATGFPSGGAILAGFPNNVTNISNCVFTGNTASSNGGAISQSSAGSIHTLTITNTTFTNNTATSAIGGAVNYSGQGNVTITGCTFTGNTAGTTGGAINISGTSPGPITTNILRNNFIGNTANGSTFGGAAVGMVSAQAININFNRLVGNTAGNVANGKVISTGGSVVIPNVNDNWWGVNTGPAASAILVTVPIVPTSWLQLRHSANPAGIPVGGTSTLTADLFGRNVGGPTSAANLTGLPAFTSLFNNPVRGTLSAPTQFVDGKATATFTATALGVASADATADSQTVTAMLNNGTATNGNISGRIIDNSGKPIEGAVVYLSGEQTRKFITDANGFYRFENVETVGFYTVTPSRVNYTFSPSSRSFSQLGESTEATFGAAATGQVANPLDTPEYFVRQHYLDFLGREPDEAGFNFWSDQIIECGTDQNCIGRRRENVSAAYFLSIEFQQTGGLVDGLYRASYGVRPNFGEFMPDTRAVGQGVVVGREGWQALLVANKTAFVNAFVNRPAFHQLYDGMDNTLFVNTLIGHTGVTFTDAERDALTSGLSGGTMTRADVLRRIAENEHFVNAKFNEAFVMMEYFGYLRRDADANGYAFWLNKLNEFNGNFERAEMVKAFIVSGEFRDRFPR